VTFCLASLVAAASGCARLDNDPDEQLGSNTAAVEQAAPLAGPAVHIAGLAPGAKLDRKQLAALGKLAPATVGAPCPTAFTPCGDPVNAIVRECGGFTDTCDSSGTEDILPLSFLCLPTQTGNVCTAIAGQNQQTIACTVPTDGRSCSTGCGGEFCANYPTQCAVQTNEVRNCFSNGVCSNDTCANQTFTQEVVGTCTRETEGDSCTPIFACDSPAVGLCNINHVCACLLGRQ
jgi:hypothetical protein